MPTATVVLEVSTTVPPPVLLLKMVQKTLVVAPPGPELHTEGHSLAAVGEAASADELISTLKALYSGVCYMVFQCQHDMSDDWGGASEVCNSRAGQDRYRIETDRQLGSAERRCKLVEEQVSNLKELFQIQWGLSQQVNVDITQLRSEILGQKREVEKSWFETSQLFEEVQNVRHERNTLQKQVSSCLLSFIL